VLGSSPSEKSTAAADPESSGGVLSGTTGCNEYSAAYAATLTGMKINLPVSTDSATCAPGLSSQEELYFLALNDVTTYRILGETLVMPYDDGKQALVFHGTQLAVAERPDRLLAHRRWRRVVGRDRRHALRRLDRRKHRQPDAPAPPQLDGVLVLEHPHPDGRELRVRPQPRLTLGEQPVEPLRGHALERRAVGGHQPHHVLDAIPHPGRYPVHGPELHVGIIQPLEVTQIGSTSDFE